ncbi:class I SAM-dependent methyltransferase, partial [Rhizobium brockwellii]|uniref:class I SAM-dependent methyltransferase n=1 Tax=Rhizobium brockwellii TaxID=3019932 RepID=UPI003F9BCF52
FGFGLDYARTLAEWRERFWTVWERIRPMGFDERFKRLREFYLFYCEAGFRARNIDVRENTTWRTSHLRRRRLDAHD